MNCAPQLSLPMRPAEVPSLARDTPSDGQCRSSGRWALGPRALSLEGYFSSPQEPPWGLGAGSALGRAGGWLSTGRWGRCSSGSLCLRDSDSAGRDESEPEVEFLEPETKRLDAVKPEATPA